MKVVTITQAKNGLSALIDVVQSGETVLIVDRGRPVARLDTAVTSALADPGGRLARLERTGVVRVGSASAARQRLQPKPSLAPGTSAVDVVVEERRSGP